MRKSILAILVFAVLLSMTHVEANGIDLYVNLDSVQYEPGERGTIAVSVRNTSEDPIEVKRMSVEFPKWMLYTEDGWDELGNQTIVYSPPIQIPSGNGTVDLEAVTFTVPTDGRAVWTDVDVWVYTNEPILFARARVDVVSPYDQRLLRAIDNMVVLLTVTAILAIVGAIIIAGAVFLSGRGSRIAWQKGE